MNKTEATTHVRWAHLASPKGESFQGFWIFDADGEPTHDKPFATKAEALKARTEKDTHAKHAG